MDDVKQYLPDFDTNLEIYNKYISEYCLVEGEEVIADGGAIPLAHKCDLPNADKFMLVQSSKEKDLYVGVMSLLNVLDCGEIMNMGGAGMGENGMGGSGFGHGNIGFRVDSGRHRGKLPRVSRQG